MSASFFFQHSFNRSAHCAFALFLALAGIRAGAQSSASEQDCEVAARRVALELAGAFSNDGFKLRDGTWSGALKPKEKVVIQVNLFAGNQYWFSAGAVPSAAQDPAKPLPTTRILVAVYDEDGYPVEAERFPEQDVANDATRKQEKPALEQPRPIQAAAGFAPKSSGAYYVVIQELEGDPVCFSFLYSYK
jgi:hypothetical protein